MISAGLMERSFPLKRLPPMKITHFLLALALGGLIAACGDDSPANPAPFAPSDDNGSTSTTMPSGSTTLTTVAADASVALSLEAIEGFFIEGFEVAIRFEDSSGRTINSTYWTDFVQSLGDPTLEDYYQSVLVQAVPPGRVTVLAQTAVGMGPPPVQPDLEGELACSLVLDLEPGQRVDVEVSFSGEADCLSIKQA